MSAFAENVTLVANVAVATLGYGAARYAYLTMKLGAVQRREAVEEAAVEQALRAARQRQLCALKRPNTRPTRPGLARQRRHPEEEHDLKALALASQPVFSFADLESPAAPEGPAAPNASVSPRSTIAIDPVGERAGLQGAQG